MGMTIEEIIAKETEEAKWFQRLANEDIASKQYGELKIFRAKRADYHNQIANTMRKYLKIQEIYLKWNRDYDKSTSDAWSDVIGVLEDGDIE